MKSIILEYECEKCKHKKIRDYSFKDFFLNYCYIGGIFFFIITLFVFVQFMFPVQISKMTSSLMTSYEGRSLTYLADRNSKTLRMIALAITEKCYDYPCRAITIFDELNYRSSYVYSYSKNGVIQDPLYTYKTGAGDCKNMAVLYSSLYNSVGGNSEVQCTYNHCFNIVHFEDNSTMIADLTMKIATFDIAFYEKEYINASTGLSKEVKDVEVEIKRGIENYGDLSDSGEQVNQSIQ